MSMNEWSIFVLFRDLLTMTYFPSSKLVCVGYSFMLTSLDSIFVIEVMKERSIFCLLLETF